MASNKEYGIAFKIGAKLQSSFPQAFKAAEKQIAALKKAAKNTGEAWTDFSKKTKALTKDMAKLSATGLALAGGVFALSSSAATAAENIKTLSIQTGLGAEALQKYQYAAQQSGVKVEDFNLAMTKYGSILAKASIDKKNNPFDKIGLSAQKMAKLGPEKSLMRVSDWFVHLKSDSERTAHAIQMFGEQAGPKMLPFLMQGSKGIEGLQSKFNELGLGFSDKDIEKAGAFQTALRNLGTAAGNIKNKAGTAFFEVFTKIIERLTSKVEELTPQIQKFAERMASLAEEKLPLLIPQIEEIIIKLGDFAGNVRDSVLAAKDFVGGWGNVGKIAVGLRLLPVAISGFTLAMNAAEVARKALTVGMTLFRAVSLSALMPILPIVIAIGLAAYVIYKNWDKLKPLFSKVFDKLKAAWDKVWGALKAGFERIKPVFKMVMDALAPFAQAAFDLILTIIESALSLLGPIFDVVSSVVVTFIDLFTGNWSALGEDIAAVINSILSLFQAAFDAVINVATSFVNGILKIFGPIKDFFENIGSKIASLFSGKKTMNVNVNATTTTTSGIAPVAGTPQDMRGVPGLATGGIFNKPHLTWFAENGPRVPEAAIPVENTARSYELWRRTGEMAGFGGESFTPAPRVMALGGGSTSVSLSMPISISGNATPETARSLEQSRDNIMAGVKRMVDQALAERSARERRLSYGY